MKNKKSVDYIKFVAFCHGEYAEIGKKQRKIHGDSKSLDFSLKFREFVAFSFDKTHI